MDGTVGKSLSRFSGWIDVAVVRAANGDINLHKTLHEDGSLTIEARGLLIQLAVPLTDHCVTPRAVAICIGAPCYADMRTLDASTVAVSDFDSPRSLQALRGRFCIVRIDLARAQVLLVTDRFAVHPVCYAVDGDRLAFSDRADSVAIGQSEIAPQAIYDYLYFHMIPAPRTIYRGVLRVPAASAVRLDDAGLRIGRTWQPRFDHASAPSIRTLEHDFREILERALEREANVRTVGCFLSGGTDSSTIAGLLTRRNGTGVPTFSIGFEAEGYDEMRYARIAAQTFRTDHHEHYMSPVELMHAIPRIAAHYDQPFGNSSTAPALSCALLAREANVGKLLGGDGGDELFGGNTRYAKQKVFEAYFALPQLLRRGIIEPTLLRLPLGKKMRWARKAASYVEQALLPMPERTESYNLLHRLAPHDLFTAQLLNSVDLLAPAALQRDVYRGTHATHIVDRMLCYDWRFTLSDNDLPKVVGATNMAGVSVGFPLLDDELVDFAVGLPPSLKVRGLSLRYFFKRALRDVLPLEIRRKRKHGFGMPFGAWLVADEGLRGFARNSLQQLVERGLLKPDAVSTLIDTRMHQHAGFYGEMVWILMMLEQWIAAHAPNFTLADTRFDRS